MSGVSSSKGQLLNVPEIKAYLSQVAPVSFNNNTFRFGEIINRKLEKHIRGYYSYDIRVNGDVIYKPYSNIVKIGKEGTDEIKGIEFIDLCYESTKLAFGWLGSLALKGRIDQSDLVGGIRVRSGNIQIGNNNILSECFRETRFGDYLLGEIHINNNQIIANSRRDNFEDSKLWDLFLSCFIRDIGIPYSRKIRELSNARNQAKTMQDFDTICKRAERIIEYGYYSEIQKADLLQKISLFNTRLTASNNNYLSKLQNRLREAIHVIDKRNGSMDFNNKKFAKAIIDAVYCMEDNKDKAEKIIEQAIGSYVQNS